MNSESLIHSLIAFGYKDYIAGRILLNNGYPMQGLTLFSSAVEKYFKAILRLLGKSVKRTHFDNGDLAASLEKAYPELFANFDKRYLGLLAKGYKVRYYDNITVPFTIGFFVNQVLGETDFTINLIEQHITLNRSNGDLILTPYKRGIKTANKDLFLNNYILQGGSKKEFMERADKGVAVHFNSLDHYNEIDVTGASIINKYEGTIWEINVQ